MTLQWEIVKSIEITRRNTPYMLMKMSDKIRETAFYCFISPERVPYERVQVLCLLGPLRPEDVAALEMEAGFVAPPFVPGQEGGEAGGGLAARVGDAAQSVAGKDGLGKKKKYC